MRHPSPAASSPAQFRGEFLAVPAGATGRKARPALAALVDLIAVELPASPARAGAGAALAVGQAKASALAALSNAGLDRQDVQGAVYRAGAVNTCFKMLASAGKGGAMGAGSAHCLTAISHLLRARARIRHHHSHGRACRGSPVTPVYTPESEAVHDERKAQCGWLHVRRGPRQLLTHACPKPFLQKQHVKRLAKLLKSKHSSSTAFAYPLFRCIAATATVQYTPSPACHLRCHGGLTLCVHACRSLTWSRLCTRPEATCVCWSCL